MSKGNIVYICVFVVLFVTAIVIAVSSKNVDKPSQNTTYETEPSATEQTTEHTFPVPETMTEDLATGTPAPYIIIDTTIQAPRTTKEFTYAALSSTTYVESTTQSTTETAASSGMNDLDYLAATVYQEAGADYVSDEARQYVAEVVLNRVSSKNFPNTIYDVLTQKRQYGMFWRYGIKKLDDSKQGVDRAYRIASNVLDGTTRDVPSNVVYQAEFPQGSGVWKYIDGIYFCYE